MTAESILFGVACGALYLTAVIKSREIRRLRALCRRCAEHLDNESHTGIRDYETHRALARELFEAGWTKVGKER